jgi:methionyl-tRNA formyltransferase
MSLKMRVLFAGSPAIAVPSLEVLCGEACREKGIELAGVLTNPDTPKGRSGTLQPTEVGEAAEKMAPLSVLKPEKLDSAAREQVAALKPDLLVSFAYGRLFGPKFLSLFQLGGINIHPSLLPKYRGPTPIQAAILNRDSVTGITVQKLAAQMDSGDIISCEYLQLTGEETTGSLSGIIAEKAAEMLPAALDKIAAGEKGTPQEHDKAGFCRLISRDDGIIDWNASAPEIEAKIRAFDPWPLCRTVHDGRELYILKAGVFDSAFESPGQKRPGTVLGIDKQDGILIQTGEGVLSVTLLQYQAKKALFWKDFLNGARDFAGSILG